MFSSLTIKAKLLCAFGLMAFLVAVLGVLNIYSLNSSDESARLLGDVALVRTQKVAEMRIHLNALQATIARLQSSEISLDTREKLLKIMHQKIEAYPIADKVFVSTGLSEEQIKLHEDVAANWVLLEKIFPSLILLGESTNPVDHQLLEKRLQAEFYPLVKMSIEAMVKLFDNNAEGVKKITEAVYSQASRLQLIALSSIAVGILLAFALGFLISRSLMTSLSQLAENMSEQARSVTATSLEVATASQQLSNGATEQAAALQQTAASLDEVNAMVQKNSENATHSSDQANTSVQSVEQSQKLIQEVVEAIEEIKISNDSIAEQIMQNQAEVGTLVAVIQEIGSKTKVINDIVFQTKLLSFNASVEAARAGEHGKGFAVVAEEVGNLAQMSGNAAKEISELLGQSITQVQKTAEATKEKVDRLIAQGKSKIDVGTRLIRGLEGTLEKINTESKHVLELNTEISRASQEQSQGVSEINKAINQLDQVTQENANAALKCSSSADGLRTNVAQLNDLVGGLNRQLYGSENTHVVHTKKAVTVSAPKVVKKTTAAPQVKKPGASVHQITQKSKPTQVVVKEKTELKQVSGEKSSIPRANDPRFEDV